MLNGDSQALAIATAAAGIGSLIASIWIGLGKLTVDFIRRCLFSMVLIGLFATACLNLSGEIISMSLLFVLTGFTATIGGDRGSDIDPTECRRELPSQDYDVVV